MKQVRFKNQRLQRFVDRLTTKQQVIIIALAWALAILLFAIAWRLP